MMFPEEAGLFQDADCGLGDGVVCNDVAVAGEKDAGLGAVEKHDF